MSKVFVLIIVIIIIAGGIFWWQKEDINKLIFGESLKACTQEAKLCLDGSYVGRTGSNCEFAPCPEIKSGTAGWQTYRNEEYGFEVKYPQDWGLEILSDVRSPYTGGIDIIQPYSKTYEPGSYVGKDLKFLVILSSSINIDNIIKDNKAEEIDLGNVIGWRYERELRGFETMILIEEVTLICDKKYCIEASELGNYGPSDYDSRSEKVEIIFSTFKFIE